LLIIELGAAISAESYAVSVIRAAVRTEHNDYLLVNLFLTVYHRKIVKSIVFPKKQQLFPYNIRLLIK
jgi:hypothetical protein